MYRSLDIRSNCTGTPRKIVRENNILSHIKKLRKICRICGKANTDRPLVDLHAGRHPEKIALFMQKYPEIDPFNEDRKIYGQVWCRNCQRNNKEPTAIFRSHTYKDCHICIKGITKQNTYAEKKRRVRKTVENYAKLGIEEFTFATKVLVKTLKEKQLEVLAREVGHVIRQDVIKDCEIVHNSYNDLQTLIELEPNEYVQQRNPVLREFLSGLTNEKVYQMGLGIANCFETIYNSVVVQLQAPFALIHSMQIYKMCTSRTVVDILKANYPCGSYNQICQLIEESKPPLEVENYEDKTLIFVMDNIQKLLKKQGIKPDNTTPCNVATNRGFIVIPNGTDLSRDEGNKPENITGIKELEFKRNHSKFPETDEKVKKSIEVIKSTIEKLEKPDMTNYNGIEIAKIHTEQMLISIQRAIEDVIEFQNLDAEDNLQDHIDSYVKDVQSKSQLTCVYCGTIAPTETKRVCLGENCPKPREGLKHAKEKRKQKSKISYRSDISWDIHNYRTVQSHHRCREENTDLAEPCELKLMEPQLVNPCSKIALAAVLDQFKEELKIPEQRKFMILTVDAVPYKQMIKLKNEAVICDNCQLTFLETKLFLEHQCVNKEDGCMTCSMKYDWLILFPGLGHVEVNIMRAFVDIAWPIYWESAAEELGFNSTQAKHKIRHTCNNHTLYKAFCAVYIASLRELVLPYVKICIRDFEGVDTLPTAQGYVEWVASNRSALGDNYMFMYKINTIYAEAILNIRRGIRKNNFDVFISGLLNSKDIFYGRHHHMYASLFADFIIQYELLCPQMQSFFRDNISHTSGSHESGQGADYKHEEANRDVLSYVRPHRLHDRKVWASAARKHTILSKLDKKIHDLYKHKVHISSNETYGHKSINVDEAAQAIQGKFRLENFLHKQEFVTLSGLAVSSGMINFFQAAHQKLVIYMKERILDDPIEHKDGLFFFDPNSYPSKISEPIPLLQSDEQNLVTFTAVKEAFQEFILDIHNHNIEAAFQFKQEFNKWEPKGNSLKSNKGKTQNITKLQDVIIQMKLYCIENLLSYQ